MKTMYWTMQTIIYTIVLFSTSFSQPVPTNKDQYQIGPDERLLITVHIWGEVSKPGEYIVPDNTDVLELISKAGGPTQFSDLSKIKITRGLSSSAQFDSLKKSGSGEIVSTSSSTIPSKKIIRLDLKKLVENEDYNQKLPILKPGDVVNVGRNTWHRWQTVIQVVSQLAIVAQVWFWYSRIE